MHLYGMENVERELKLALSSLSNPDAFSRMGLAGRHWKVLLHGESGTGKTAVLKKVVGGIDFNVVWRRCGQFFNQYLGDSEAALRAAFDDAQAMSPCVLVYDFYLI